MASRGKCLSTSRLIVSRLGNRADMQRRAGKARAIAVATAADEGAIAAIALAGTGLLLAALLALLLISP